MKKFIIFLWIFMLIGFSFGGILKGYKFMHSRASTLCLSCMGLEK